MLNTEGQSGGCALGYSNNGIHRRNLEVVKDVSDITSKFRNGAVRWGYRGLSVSPLVEKYDVVSTRDKFWGRIGPKGRVREQRICKYEPGARGG